MAECISAAPAFRHFASYFEMTPTPDESAGVRRHGHISQRGPSVVRGVLVKAAEVVIRRCRLLLGQTRRLDRSFWSYKLTAALGCVVLIEFVLYL